jgi:riboflavin kinase/FMN adenylyltransferase
MIGRVVQGERLGRTLGYATANMRLGRLRSPVQGIFAVRVRGAVAGAGAAGPSKLPGAASSGTRPTVGGVASLGTRPTVGGMVPLLETHLFDFTGDLYGREIEVEFVAKLRDEQRFGSLEALVEQMQRDATEARSVLNI